MIYAIMDLLAIPFVFDYMMRNNFFYMSDVILVVI